MNEGNNGKDTVMAIIDDYYSSNMSAESPQDWDILRSLEVNGRNKK